MSDRAAKKGDAFEGFRNELIARDEEIGSLLPTTISREAFRNTAIIAVKKNPQLLECERRSLHNAVSAAAFDGLRPDGKEGVILPRREKFKVKDDKGKETEKWHLVASWQPMTYGIRKRARELDSMVIDAAVVHKNDTFDWDVGDTPYIHHKPTPLDTDPGEMVGVYAIFRRGDDILHREVMRKVDVMAVKSISKQKDGLLWTRRQDGAVLRQAGEDHRPLRRHARRLGQRQGQGDRGRGAQAAAASATAKRHHRAPARNHRQGRDREGRRGRSAEPAQASRRRQDECGA
jgi:RecT family